MKLIGKDLYADEGKWLYQGESTSRMFWKSVTLAKVENAQYYNECADEEHLAWKSEYEPEPEPIEPIEE